jgi:hypothetical protein
MEETKVEAKFGEWIVKGFNLWKDNIAVLAVAGLITLPVGIATLGVLFGPLYAGMTMIVLRLIDKTEPKPEGTDVFKGMQLFVHALLFVIVWGAIPVGAGMVIGMIPFVGGFLSNMAMPLFVAAAQTLSVFGMFLIVDRKMSFMDASMKSIDIVKTNFWVYLGLAVVAGAIASLGLAACCVGVMATISLMPCIVGSAYRELFPKEDSASTSTPA